MPSCYTTLAVTHEPGRRIGRITLSRPARLNAIDTAMPGEIRAAVEGLEADDAVHVIVLAGAGRAFCAGYDLVEFGSGQAEHPCQQERQPWEPTEDYAVMKRYTEDFMALWRSRKPTIAMVQGVALAGGSDIAMCCDLLVMADDAKIGYPPARVWGCPTTAMWTYRLGPMRAKLLTFTGDMIDGRTAAAWGLATEAVPADRLEAATLALAERIAAVPRSQLAMHKLVVNQALLSMGLEQTQMFATLFDGITRHDPAGLWFRREAQAHGFKAAVQWRDGGSAIPEGDEARARIAVLEAEIAALKKAAGA